MCVIFVSYNKRKDFPLVIAANRDEFYNRPTAEAGRWEDYPFITAGRDLVAQGTWLGMTDCGRFAAVTNFRQPGQAKGARSRGELVSGFLISSASGSEYMKEIQERKKDFTGFNLLAGQINSDKNELFYYSNRIDEPRKLKPGTFGVSNHLLDTPWPKITLGKKRFSDILSDDPLNREDLFKLLSDKSRAADRELPDTGIGLEYERLLSPLYIETPVYGTRSSTVLTIDSEFNTNLEERTFV